MHDKQAPKSKVLAKIAKWTAIGAITLTAVLGLTGWIGSSIPRNSDWTEPDPSAERTIEIMVGTNGIHTEIAMPKVTAEIDWRPIFPVADLSDASRPYTHVAVSWGEREFFQATPRWSDLNPLIALRAMAGGEPVLHVAHYVRPAPSSDYRILHLRPDEYIQLASMIRSQLSPANERETLPGYTSYDVFYTAQGTYHIANTCNQWTSDQLAASGVRIGSLTPFSGGVMKWIADPLTD